jgi:hypothetical protein
LSVADNGPLPIERRVVRSTDAQDVPMRVTMAGVVPAAHQAWNWATIPR